MMIVLYQFINVFFLYLYYGPVAMIFSPGKTWMVIWSTYALYRHRWSFHGREIDLLHDDEDEDDDGDWLKALWRSTSRKILRRRSVVVKSDSADMKMNNESTARLYTKERKQAQHSKKA
jgi:nuclear transport factor 2 (NTF2) superfamily protein